MFDSYINISLSISDLDRRKIALLIGNNDYNWSKNKLPYAINNVDDLSNKLEDINFNIRRCENLDHSGIDTEIKKFAEEINDGDLVLFYFSGHACHVRDRNYLIPINDDGIESEREVPRFGINVDQTINRLMGSKQSYVTIVIIDCGESYQFRTVSVCK